MQGVLQVQRVQVGDDVHAQALGGVAAQGLQRQLRPQGRAADADVHQVGDGGVVVQMLGQGQQIGPGGGRRVARGAGGAPGGVLHGAAFGGVG